MRPHVALPRVSTNRIKMPDVAERILASGGADMVSTARPLLADPWWVAKARKGKAHEINTCIACNQACLDLVFQKTPASCLVNPRPCHETELASTPTHYTRNTEVVGAGHARQDPATTTSRPV